MRDALQKLLPQCTVSVTATPDPYGGALRIAYTSALPEDGTVDHYISRSVLIEIGARSIKEPTVEKVIAPYISERLDRSEWNLNIDEVTIICAERTFWDKIYIIDRFCRSHSDASTDTANRISRHFYDVSMIYDSRVGKRAINLQHIQESVRKYTKSPITATPGSLRILPPDNLLPHLERDYNEGTSRMMFGSPIPFSAILSRLRNVDEILNGAPLRASA
jgi:hypothetical protein